MPQQGPSELLRGSTLPRLWTPELRPLTPETSYGFDVIRFANDIGHPLLPWQEWLVIRIGELNPDGTPRFRRVLVMVARQNGKTYLLKVLAAYWMFAEEWPVLLGIHTKLNSAIKVMKSVHQMAMKTPKLKALLPQRKNSGLYTVMADPHIETARGDVYTVAASNSNAGRGDSVDRIIHDELRQEKDWQAYDASYNAMNARPEGQAFYLSNAGDDTSVVLNSLRDNAVKYIEAVSRGEDTSEHDESLGLFEWSAPPGADILDPVAQMMANPACGYLQSPKTIMNAAKSAMAKGGDEVTSFKTEVLCQRVPKLDPAIEKEGWDKCADPELDMTEGQKRAVVVVDISTDQQHATAVVATTLSDGRTAVQTLGAWSGKTAGYEMSQALPGLIQNIKPKKLGYFKRGPIKSQLSKLKILKSEPGQPKTKWELMGIESVDFTGEYEAACMGLAEDVKMGDVVHADDEALNLQVLSVGKKWSGPTWVFDRADEGHSDAAYCVAGAVYLAKTLPPPGPAPLIVLGGGKTER